ncbi:hemagglutinin repeat-containing protein (plasmid) [Chromobacterium amazonense]|nr:hemagglutinin repeat-containing protein [Chromobacterium amazonense]
MQLQAGRNLSISASGNLVNNGQLQSGGSLSLSGLNWTNNGSVSIGGTFSTHLSQNLYNYGTLGADALDLNAANVTNAGSITARDIAIRAGNLDNSGGKALLASAGNMALNIGGTLNNHDGAWIYSLGDMRIGQSGVQVGQVVNHIATLQSDGNMFIEAKRLQNSTFAPTFHTEQKTENDRYDPIIVQDRGPRGQIEMTTHSVGAYVSYDEVSIDVLDSKNNPARILASGNIIVNAGEISNEYSSINAGGGLISVSSVPFKNIGKELNKTTRHVETTICDGGDFSIRPGECSPSEWIGDVAKIKIGSVDAIAQGNNRIYIQAPAIYNTNKGSVNVPTSQGSQLSNSSQVGTASGSNVQGAGGAAAANGQTLSAGSAEKPSGGSVAHDVNVGAGEGQALNGRVGQASGVRLEGNAAGDETGRQLQGRVGLAQGAALQSEGPAFQEGQSLSGSSQQQFAGQKLSGSVNSVAGEAVGGKSLPRQSGQHTDPLAGHEVEGSAGQALAAARLDEQNGARLVGEVGSPSGHALSGAVSAMTDGAMGGKALGQAAGQALQGSVGANDAAKLAYGVVSALSAAQLGGQGQGAVSAASLGDSGVKVATGMSLSTVLSAVPAMQQMVLEIAGVKAGNPVAHGYQAPDNGLFHSKSAPNQPYLVETNPQFTQYAKFVSSDYLLKQLSYDPNTVSKRLGDGFYEQHLVSKAITDMTGRIFLSGYGSAMEQYQQLMNHGVQYAQKFQLTPGVALSAEQMSQLTSDMVWLVKQTVNNQDVLVPVVYLANADKKSLLGLGAVLAGSNMTLLADGNLINSGVLQADATLYAKAGDIHIEGGAVKSAGDLSLNAANNIIVADDISFSKDGVRIEAGNLQMIAGNDLKFRAADVKVSGNGWLQAGHDIEIGNRQDSYAALSDDKGSAYSWTKNTGSSFSFGGMLGSMAGNDILLIDSSVQAVGGVQAKAGHDINILSSLDTSQGNSSEGWGWRSSSYNYDWKRHNASVLDGGGNVALQAGNNLTVLGSSVQSGGLLTVQVAGNIAVQSEVDGNRFQLNGRGSSHDWQNDRLNVAGLSAKGDLQLHADGDALLNGASLASGGKLTLSAGNDIKLGAVATESRNDNTWGETIRNNYDLTQRGTTVQGEGGLLLKAGRDISTQAANLTSNGQEALIAGRDVNLGSAQERHSDYSKTVHHSSGWFSSSTTTDIVAHDSTHEAGSTVSADTVILKGQRDINIHASQVAGSGDVTLDAGRNLNITSGTDTSRLFQYHKEETSGLFSGGGLGFTIGSKELTQQLDGAGTTQSQNRSLVGSIGGNLNIKTGDTLTLQGSDVTAGGNLYLDTRKQNLDVAVDTWHSVQKTESKSSGLTVQLTSPLISGVQAMASAADTAAKSKDDRVKALSTATAALAGYNSYAAYQQAMSKAAEGTKGGIQLSLTVGSSHSESTTVSDSHTESGSLLKSGGTLVDLAHGAGQGSTITGKGAQFVAGKDLTLQAEGDIKLLAAKSTSSEHTTSSSSSGAVGVGISFDKDAPKFGIMANASMSRGHVDGNGSQYQLSELNAGGRLNLVSGGNVTLQGIAKGQQVVGDIAGDLKLDSLQDTSTYHSQNQTVSGNVTIGIGAGSGGSASLSQQKMDADYASVQRQSGIQAGDGGFQVKVGGTTTLNGAEIASSDKAVADGKNSLQTGALVLKDIDNHADFTASSVSVTAGTSGVSGMAMAASDHDKSVTRAGISGGSLIITNNALQEAQTGQTASQAAAGANRNVSSDKDGSGKLANNFDANQVQGLFDAANALNQQVGTFMANKAAEAKAAKEEADKAQKDPNKSEAEKAQLQTAAADAAKWAPGGAYSQILTAVTAGIGGNVANGLAGMAQNAGIAYLQGLGAQEVKKLADQLEKDQNPTVESETVRAVLHAALACVGANASGQSCGAGAAGGAASVALNNALDAIQHTNADKMTAEQKLQRENLVSGLLAGVAAGTGGANTAATTVSAAKTEMENNYLSDKQEEAKKRDKAACKQSWSCLAAVEAKWGAVSIKQDAAFGGGMLAGVPASLYDAVKGVIATVSSPVQTYEALRNLINHDDMFATVGQAVKQSYLDRIDRMESEYQRAGAGGAFNAGQEAGKLLTDAASLLAGGAGLAKTGVQLTEKITVAAVSATEKAASSLAGVAKFDRLVANGGRFAADGRPMMDFSQLTTAQKGVVGDLMGGEKIQQLVPGAKEIGFTPGVGQSGIDGLYQVNKPGVDYIVVEYKFGASKQGMTKDGLQGSDSWLTGANTNYNRILESVGNDQRTADAISDSLKAGRVEKWLVHTDPFGRVTVGIMGRDGRLIPDPEAASKLLGGKR